MNDYLRRLVKYLIFITIIVFILVSPQIFKSGDDLTTVIIKLFERQKLFFTILIVYIFLYPVLVFGKKERHLNGTFSKNKDAILRTIEEQNFILRTDENNQLIFRKKSALARIVSMGEDKLVIDYSNNPIMLNGTKKDLARIDKLLDLNLLNKE